MTFEELLECFEPQRIKTNSKEIITDDIFVAIRGEHIDGHKFVGSALENGAKFVIVDDLQEGVDAGKQIIVDNTAIAYGLLGQKNRKKFAGKVIALTGSAGKTTTKEELKFILSKFGRVYATKDNFNNHIGVPLTLLELDMSADFAIIEMGMSGAGELSKLTSYTQPDIAIITNVFPMHIEFFNNFEEIAYAKSEIFEGLKSDGIAIINEDANFSKILVSQAKEHKIIKFNKNSFEFVTSFEGEHHIYNGNCVLSVVKALGLDIKLASQHIKDFAPLDGRGKHHKLSIGDGFYTLIDDSYSGQPDSMKLAIQSLGKMKKTGRKVAILGKMAELGDTSKARHIEIGQELAKIDIDAVIGVREESQDILSQLPNSVNTHFFESIEGLEDFLINKFLQKEDIVLIKGARYSSQLYQIANALIKRG